MESYSIITNLSKAKHQSFDFYINELEEEKNKNSDFMDKILGIPQLPLIGYKNKKQLKSKETKKKSNSHILGKIMSLVAFQIQICQGENNDEIINKYYDFCLPQNLAEYLNIEDYIEIDNNTDDQTIQYFWMPKKKLNFYFIISELPNFISDNNSSLNKPKEEKDTEKKVESKINENFDGGEKIAEDEEDNLSEDYDEIINDNNIIYNNKFDNVNRINIINEKEEEENEVKKYESKAKSKSLLLNIIPQIYYGKNNALNLIEIKNISYQKQITLFSINDRHYHDIWTNQRKDHMDINNLRVENSDISFQDGQLIFSDNLKFKLNIDRNLGQFYLIITSPEEEYHSVFYFVTVNNFEAKKKMGEILSTSFNIKEMIQKIKDNFYENSYRVINSLIEMFSVEYK